MSDRRAKPFDLLALLAAFARARGIALDDPALIATFTDDASGQLKRALNDPALLYGTRAERLFEALLLTLGKFRLFKVEDNGRVHAATKLRAPDFRVVLENGEQRLIEVKNVYCEEPLEQEIRLTPAYYRSVQDYADTVGIPLRLAIYWARWNIWTMVAPGPFTCPDGSVVIAFMDAMVVNELARLGDVSIATRPPLRIVRDVAQQPFTHQSLDDLPFVGPARLFSGDTELTHPRDRKLAEILCLYGQWPAVGPQPVLSGTDLIGVQYAFEPGEPSDQDAETVGTASRIFSQFYVMETIEGDRIVQLLGQPQPDWFAPLNDWPFKESSLPLWLFSLQPNHELLEEQRNKPPEMP